MSDTASAVTNYVHRLRIALNEPFALEYFEEGINEPLEVPDSLGSGTYEPSEGKILSDLIVNDVSLTDEQRAAWNTYVESIPALASLAYEIMEAVEEISGTLHELDAAFPLPKRKRTARKKSETRVETAA